MRVQPWLPMYSDFNMGGVGLILIKGGMVRVCSWLQLNSLEALIL